ncbi:MAG: HEAT repeat domain-containing protein, partial [Planctomycetaceae bacterium]
PAAPESEDQQQISPQPDGNLATRIEYFRRASNTSDAALMPLFQTGIQDSNPHIRFWSALGLGACRTTQDVQPIALLLGDRVKSVREAALWAARQILIDDQGWDDILAAAVDGDDYRREAAVHALLMRVDGVMPGLSTDWKTLTGTLAYGMNQDTHPAVRAWATRAAWNWWVWNPPVRGAINDAWIALLQRPETNALVENAIRYQSQALFIANGHKANQSRTHQYRELGVLFETLADRLAAQTDRPDEESLRIARRLVGIGATFYNTSGGDGGPGQMGYSTPHATYLFGLAAMIHLGSLESRPDDKQGILPIQVALEGAANVSFSDLQQKLIHYSLHGPETLRPIASSSVSDPRSAQLVAVAERIEPLVRQLNRGAMEPARRPQLSEPILKMFAQVQWIIPDTHEQQHEVFGYLQPPFPEYLSPDAITAIPAADKRGAAERDSSAYWYLARGIGDAIGQNPDLHHDVMLEFFPEQFQHPQLARFWLPSVEWILLHKTTLPDVQPGKLPPIDPLEEVRTRALRLFLDQLVEQADPETRKFAVRMAQRTALRRNPEILTALEKMLTFEQRKDVVKDASNVLKQNRNNFVKELEAAVRKETPPRIELQAGTLPTEFVADFAYFRDYVTPEMNRVLRGDQRSCFACHGVKGRVPPLELNRPDDAGYLSVEQLLNNYRKLQARVDLNNIDKSKLLRKPLNVQTGQEDGHQGGRRYQPDDPGYRILTNWARNQKKHSGVLGRNQARLKLNRPPGCADIMAQTRTVSYASRARASQTAWLPVTGD